VAEPKGPVEENEQDAEEFEQILNWIDKEFDLEVAQNSKHCLSVSFLVLTHPQYVHS